MNQLFSNVFNMSKEADVMLGSLIKPLLGLVI